MSQLINLNIFAARHEAVIDWISQQLDAQGSDLSDAQIFTLFIWAHAEWQRAIGADEPQHARLWQFASAHWSDGD